MVSRLTFELATSIDPRDPRTFLGRELPGFALFDTEIVVAGQGVDYTDIPVESAPPPDLEEKLAKDREPAKSEDQRSPEDSGEEKPAARRGHREDQAGVHLSYPLHRVVFAGTFGRKIPRSGL